MESNSYYIYTRHINYKSILSFWTDMDNVIADYREYLSNTQDPERVKNALQQLKAVTIEWYTLHTDFSDRGISIYVGLSNTSVGNLKKKYLGGKS